MDETATRLKKIDPKLYEEGWEQVPQSIVDSPTVVPFRKKFKEKTGMTPTEFNFS